MQSYAKNVSMTVVRRLPKYYQYLKDLEDRGVEKISSKELASLMGLTASQIRQDLNSFGAYGQQGYGYRVLELKEAIKQILGTFRHVRLYSHRGREYRPGATGKVQSLPEGRHPDQRDFRRGSGRSRPKNGYRCLRDGRS